MRARNALSNPSQSPLTIAGSRDKQDTVLPIQLTDSQQSAVREELDRILRGAPFKNSKRYSSFLRYVVEQTLEGHAERLKERAIGIDVFEREADYDTNTDHAVRSAACEVRRRLARHYEGDCETTSSEAEVRIEIRAGSYVPQFIFQATEPKRFGPALIAPLVLPQVETRSTRPSTLRFAGVSLVVVASLAAAVYSRLPQPNTPLQDFWMPMLKGSTPVVVAISGIANDPGTVRAQDASAAARLAAFVESKGGTFRIVTSAAQARSNLDVAPLIVIGDSQEAAANHAASGLRYRVQRDSAGLAQISDGNETTVPASWSGEVTYRSRQGTAVATAYALISRFRNAQGKHVVMLSGLDEAATTAASEFVSNEEHVRSLATQAPPDWVNKNVQVVLATEITNGAPGPPRIVATHYW